MKKNLIISSVVGSLLLFSAAQAHALDRSSENQLVSICQALQSNSKLKLRRVIAQSNLSYKKLSEGLVCNGMDPVTFALRSDALKTAKLFAQKSNMDYQTLLAKL